MGGREVTEGLTPGEKAVGQSCDGSRSFCVGWEDVCMDRAGRPGVAGLLFKPGVSGPRS